MDAFDMTKLDAADLVRRAGIILRSGALQRVPGPIRANIEQQLEDLAEMLTGDRAPRFAIVGRRGAGKSSLINAIFGQPVAEIGATAAATGRGQWYPYQSGHGSIEVLDTRGLGEGGATGAAGQTPLEDLHAALAERCPDALLVLCKAKELDARIDEDLENIREVIAFVEAKHGYALPVVGIVTQVDELDPADIADPPFDDPEKQGNIEAAVAILQERLAGGLGIDAARIAAVIPVCAYMRFRDGQIAVDRRWHIEKLLLLLIDHLPKSAQVQLARVSMLRSVRLKVAGTLVHATSVVAAAIAATPIPIADIFPLVGLQCSMVAALGVIGGKEMNLARARDFLASMGLAIGAGMLAREVFRQVAKFVPGLGSVVGAGIAYTTTWSLGQAATAYYITGASEEEARSILEREQQHEPPATIQSLERD